VEKGLAKKSKVSGREGSTRKRTAYKAWDCGKYVGERIGGYLGVPRDGSQRRTSIEWDQVTLNKGSVGGQTTRDKRGQTTRSGQERANNTGQERANNTGQERANNTEGRK
jgi:hypothetical protein